MTDYMSERDLVVIHFLKHLPFHSQHHLGLFQVVFLQENQSSQSDHLDQELDVFDFFSRGISQSPQDMTLVVQFSEQPQRAIWHQLPKLFP